MLTTTWDYSSLTEALNDIYGASITNLVIKADSFEKAGVLRYGSHCIFCRKLPQKTEDCIYVSYTAQIQEHKQVNFVGLVCADKDPCLLKYSVKS